jgi:ABC-2 type transport system permease protein
VVAIMGIILEIARKELIENIISKRFFVIMFILVLVSIYAIPSGIDYYNSWLHGYKDHNSTAQSWRWRAVDSLQQNINSIETNGGAGGDIQSLKSQIYLLSNPIMPSIVDVFQKSIPIFMIIGAIFGASIGFDSILKEKKDGTLKSIISTPVYRDEYIIGKVVGAFITLAIAFASILILAIAILLFSNIVPDTEDLVRIVMYFIIIILFCMLFYSVALMISLFVKNSSRSILYSIFIIILLFIASIILPSIANNISSLIIGPAPTEVFGNTGNTQVSNIDNTISPTVSPADVAYFEQSSSYSNKMGRISEAITTISPINNFIGNFDATPRGVAILVLTRQNYELHNYIIGFLPIAEPVTLWDTISAIWYKVLILVIEIIATLAVTFTKFMRMDI